MAQKNNLIVVKSLQEIAPKNEPYRLLCMTGQNKGQSYFLTGKRIVMGRGDDVDIQVLDSKSSRHHAELSKVKDQYILTDLHSQNGTFVNGSKISQHSMQNNDKIIIGKTVFKYNFIEIKEEVVKEIEETTTSEEEEFEEETPVKDKSKSNRIKTILMGLLLVFAVLLLLEEDEEDASRKRQLASPKLTDNQILLSTKLPKKSRKKEERDDVLAAYIHRGQREYREGNFLRALEEFRMALIISPENSRAAYYENKTQQALNNKINAIFVKATRESDALSYEAAAHSYCAILRLIQDFPNDKRFKQALAKKHEVEEQLGLDKDEIKCIQK